LLETSAGAFYSVDCEGNTTLVSRSFLEMMGFADEAEVIGKKLHAVIHHTHPTALIMPWKNAPSTAAPRR
jgi:PAS domain S-box-containing protein